MIEYRIGCGKTEAIELRMSSPWRKGGRSDDHRVRRRTCGREVFIFPRRKHTEQAGTQITAENESRRVRRPRVFGKAAGPGREVPEREGGRGFGLGACGTTGRRAVV